MEETVFTPRLKLTLISSAERGSHEFEWLHELRSDEQSTWWSLAGRSTSPEHTEKQIQIILPVRTSEGEAKIWRILYAVHEVLPTAETPELQNAPTRFVGMVTVRSIRPDDVPLPASMFPDSSAPSATTLNLELGYGFLPTSWGKGIATESVNAVLGACRRATSLWAPFESVYVRAVANAENIGSVRVLGKTEMQSRGVHVITGSKPVWLAGKMRDSAELPVFGMFLKD